MIYDRISGEVIDARQVIASYQSLISGRRKYIVTTQQGDRSFISAGEESVAGIDAPNNNVFWEEWFHYTSRIK